MKAKTKVNPLKEPKDETNAAEGVPILDAFEDWPVEDPQTYADCQAAEKFTKKQSWGAVKKTLDVLVRPLELYGGLGAADENFHAFKVTKSGNMVDYLTKEYKSNVGKWFVAWTFPGIVVLKMVYVGDGFLRILLVFIPWCKMMCSKSGETIQWWDLLAHETSCLSAHWAYTFLRVLEEPNSSLVTNKSLGRLLEDNIAFQFGIYVSDLVFVGLCPKTCALFFKNRLEGEKGNLFHPDCTNLLRERDGTIYGYPCRKKLARYADEELPDGEVTVSKMTIDNKFVMGALMAASYEADNDDEMVESLLYSVDHDRLHDDAKCNSSKASMRLEAILAKDKAIPRVVRDTLQTRYDATRLNSGNRSNHSSVSDEQMTATDRALLHWNARQGTAAKKFFVMGQGTATGDTPKNNDKTPFVVPADGTVLRPEHPRGQAPVVFRKADFVPGLTYYGLLERCKPMKTEGKTNSKQCVKFLDDRIRFTEGIMRFTNKWHWCNGHNVVEVWFEPKKYKRPKTSKSPVEFTSESPAPSSAKSPVVKPKAAAASATVPGSKANAAVAISSSKSPVETSAKTQASSTSAEQPKAKRNVSIGKSPGAQESSSAAFFAKRKKPDATSAASASPLAKKPKTSHALRLYETEDEPHPETVFSSEAKYFEARAGWKGWSGLIPYDQSLVTNHFKAHNKHAQQIKREKSGKPAKDFFGRPKTS